MRILYITEHWPWPARSGARLRAAATVRALVEWGEVDVLHLDRGWRHSWREEGSDLPRLATSVPPADVARTDSVADMGVYPPEAAEMRQAYGTQVREWLDAHEYDLIWLNRVITWTTLPRQRQCAVVIDVDDLEDRLVLQGVGHMGNKRTFTDPAEAAADPAVVRQATQWRRLQEDAASDVDWLVLTSGLDAFRMGQDHCSVVPNVYIDTSPAVPLDADDPRPRILFTGLFNYPPNADAARRLVKGILPLVQRRLPGACVWLVGEDIRGRLADLAGRSVRLFGQVPDVKPYVLAADVVAVPLRQGSGTRLKILEAFALGTPVVSTPLGAEGLDLISGEHLLIADAEADLAAAIVRVALDRDLRDALVSAGERRFADRHGLPTLRSAVGAAVERAMMRRRGNSASASLKPAGGVVSSQLAPGMSGWNGNGWNR